ncbi:MAG: outer membrane beta-barrel protein [Calditrichaeota bacterium]|nr:outer membrane beta-barrel protein [Calditrichota bacterium]MCB0295831.1 outer membrane beta-barrel protein [Calditrichota bacterium]MCB9090276.1 outer membrane beta-barrel protein [Calditrichia bacterium]
MNRYLLLFLLGLFLLPVSETVNAQTRSRPYAEFSIGSINPKDTGIGNVFGISTGRRLDDRLYWGINVNYFKTSYLKITTVADSGVGGINFSTKEVELDFTTRILSLHLLISYELKLGEDTPFYYRASAGAGGEFIWNNENNFLEDIDRTRFFNGFGWQLTTGLGLKISRAGVIFADILYHNATARKNRERNERGLPTFQEIDVSGFGARVGINIIGLGF